MGKRKKSSRKRPTPKKKEPLPTTFSCLFCNHENCVTVKLDKKLGFGNLSCKVCGQRFQTRINYLSAAVDVYSDWIDACDAVAKEDMLAKNDELGGSATQGLGDSQSRTQDYEGATAGGDLDDDDEY
ncbi:hypothetical protein VTO42DRAFT_4639 [Malbranchea cinnamomea]